MSGAQRHLENEATKPDRPPTSSALVLVDLQAWILRTFLATVGSAVVAEAGRLLARARLDGVPVIHVRYLKIDGSDGGPDSPETRFVDGVTPIPGEEVVDKFGISAFSDTRLHQVLERLVSDRLILAGVVTEGGVLGTVEDAVRLGYRVTVPVKAMEGNDPRAHEAALTRMAELEGVTLVATC